MNRHSIFMRFPGGRQKTVTLSYDDAVDQDNTLVELMRKYKMKGTFNVSTGWLAEEGTVYPEGETHRRMTVEQCKKCYDKTVCEVACHAYNHPWISTLPGAMMMDQVVTDRKKLEEMFQVIIRGMAYPYGVYNDELVEILRMADIRYCRTVNSSHSFYLPEDWLRLNPTCHHDDENLDELVDRFLNQYDEHWPAMFYLWGHTFEFERNNNWNVIEEFMQKVSGRDDIWYATNGEIYEYTKAFNSLEFSVDGTRIHNPSNYEIWAEIDEKMVVIPAGGDIC